MSTLHLPRGVADMEEMLRYARNLGSITREEQHRLSCSRVCIVGCGGLGGFLAECLGRLGVGHLTVVDGDRFEITNLNRQLLSAEDNLGLSKAEEAKKRLARINPSVHVTAVTEYLTRENAALLLQGHDLVLDALDSIPDRLMLQRSCAQLRLPLVHGAVEGWFGQVTTVLPGDDALTRLYPGYGGEEAGESTSGTLSFAPAFIASVQAAEGLKLLLGKEPTLRGRVLYADLLFSRFDILPV